MAQSTVEAFAWDVEEANTRQTKVFQVRHWRHTKQGGYKLTDPRDIYELVANNGARRLRACILGVIPGDVIDAAVACNVSKPFVPMLTLPQMVCKNFSSRLKNTV